MWQAAVGAAAGNIAGTIYQAAEQRRAAINNRDFQREMSNSAYQRAMADMEKAGLNPILAGKLGGASTPGGATAQVPDMTGIGTSTVNAAIAAKNAQVEVKQKQMQNMSTANQLKIEQEAMKYYDEHPDRRQALLEAQLAKMVGVRPELGAFGGLVRQGITGANNISDTLMDAGASTAQRILWLWDQIKKGNIRSPFSLSPSQRETIMINGKRVPVTNIDGRPKKK